MISGFCCWDWYNQGMLRLPVVLDGTLYFPRME